MNIFQKSFKVFNWQTIQKCQLFIETPGIWIYFTHPSANIGMEYFIA